MEYDGDNFGSGKDVGTEKEISATNSGALAHELEGGHDSVESDVNPVSSSDWNAFGYENGKKKRKRNRRKGKKSKLVVDSKNELAKVDAHMLKDEGEMKGEATPLLIDENLAFENEVQPTQMEKEEHTCIDYNVLDKEILCEESDKTSNSDCKYEETAVPEEDKTLEEQIKVEEIQSNETVNKSTAEINPLESQQFRRRVCAAVFDMEPPKQEECSQENFSFEQTKATDEVVVEDPEKIITIIYQARDGFSSDTSVAGCNSEVLSDGKPDPGLPKISDTEVVPAKSACSIVFETMNTMDVETKSNETEDSASAGEQQQEKSISAATVYPDWATVEDIANNNYLPESEDEDVSLYNQFGAERKPSVLHADGITDILEQNIPQGILIEFGNGTSESFMVSSPAFESSPTLAQQIEEHLNKHLKGFTSNRSQKTFSSVAIPEVPNPSMVSMDGKEKETDQKMLLGKSLNVSENKISSVAITGKDIESIATQTEQDPISLKPVSGSFETITLVRGRSKTPQAQDSGSTIQRGFRRLSRGLRNLLPSCNQKPKSKTPTRKDSLDLVRKNLFKPEKFKSGQKVGAPSQMKATPDKKI